MIKNFKALDNIRNTQAGHIQIDYRITCAMINFTHKPTCPDKENAKKIAVKLKEKLDFENNLLSGLLKKQFGTKEIFSIDHNSIKDFPKLSEKKLKNKIFFGTFQIRQSKSYISDIIKSGKAFYVCESLVLKIKQNSKEELDSKILALEIVSRHKRSVNKNVTKKRQNDYTKEFRNSYKVFIEYVPSLNKSKAIKSVLEFLKLFFFQCYIF